LTDQASSAEPPAKCQLKGITKRFGELVATDAVDFSVRRGEIHALVGENGAGKTTLMRILFGMLRPDEGVILIDGEPVEIEDSHRAIELGLGMVHQHFMLVPNLSGLENVALGVASGADEHSIRLGPLCSELRHQLDGLATAYGFEVSLDRPVWQLSVGEKQRLEILKALRHGAEILILDEPTASLTPDEARALMNRLRDLAAGGATIIVITHHLDEVVEHADRATVLRRGRHVATLDASELDAKTLATLMVSHEVSTQGIITEVSTEQLAVARPSPSGARSAKSPVLEVSGLRAEGDHGQLAVHDLDLQVAAGEIVAVVGVEGNGQRELEECVIGVRPTVRGTVRLSGSSLAEATPGMRLEAGLGFIPSDRYRFAMLSGLSIGENLVADRYREGRFSTALRLKPGAIWDFATDLIEEFRIRTEGPQSTAGTLSGGNAQKLVIARAMTRDLKAIVAAQPSRGLDVGAIEAVWGYLHRLRAAGVAVLLITSDLDEALALSDQVAVLHRGRKMGQWDRLLFDRDLIGRAMGGVSPDGEREDVG